MLNWQRWIETERRQKEQDDQKHIKAGNYIFRKVVNVVHTWPSIGLIKETYNKESGFRKVDLDHLPVDYQ